MLKNRMGEAIAGDGRPRKKLSFRDPEVVAPSRSAPSFPPSKRSASPHPARPHSVAGVVGLGGFSSSGGVSGTASSSTATSGSEMRVATPSPGHPSPSLPPKSLSSYHSSQSPTRCSTKGHSRHSSYDGSQNVQRQNFQDQSRQQQQQLLYHQQQQQLNYHQQEQQQHNYHQQEQQQQDSHQQEQQLNYHQQQQLNYYQSQQLNYHSQQQQPQTRQPPSSKREENYIVLEDPPKHQLPKSPNKSDATNRLQKNQANQRPQQQKHAQSMKLNRQQQDNASINNGRTIDQIISLSLEDLELENQAMRVVRTIGQAFEVCHKMAVKDKSPSPEPHGDDISREGSEDSSDKPKRDGLDSESGQEDLMTLTSDTFNDDGPDNLPSRPFKLEPLAPPIGSDILKKGVGETFTSPLSEPLPTGDFLPQAGTPLSVHHELQLLREQLEQQQQQTQAAVAQVHLLRDQLAAETAARLEAQARTHQLLVHNKELLEHIQQLVLQVRDLEVKIQGGNSSGGGGVSGAIPMPPNLPETKHELSPSASGASEIWLSQLSKQLSQQSSAISQLSATLPDTPPTPSPTMATRAFLFPPSLPSSSSPTFPLLQSPFPPLSPLITPLPLSAGDVTLPMPRQESHLHAALQQNQQRQHLQEQQRLQHQHQSSLQSMQQQLRQRDFAHLQQWQQGPQWGEEGSSTVSLSSDSDLKKDSSGQSSGESVTAAIAQLYSIDPRRLPQVPEDSVPITQFGTGAMGTQRFGLQRGPLNGPITRAASERYSRQETLAQMQRMEWARHTTK